MKCYSLVQDNIIKKKLNNDCIKKSSRRIEVLVDFGF